ncbi:amidohydrolase family protein [Aliikangiella sp. IMCC44632]
MLKRFVILCAFFTMPASSQEVLEYEWLTMGKVTGSQVVEYKANKVTIDFGFSDRGLGPKLRDEITLSKSGTILKQKISGNAFMGNKVSELFTLVDKQAQWRNDLEDDARNLQHNRFFYIAANPTPQGLELLINAIQQTNKASIDLLPSGRASVEKLLSVTVTTNNQTKEVTLHAITGLAYTPDYVWLDSNNRLFAMVMGSMNMVRKGWSHTVNKLQSAQDTVFESFMKNLSEKSSIKLPETLVINNVNVFNSIDDKLQKQMQVVIQDGKVVEINSTARLFVKAKVIDGAGKTLMAGLWDMHAHTSLEDGLFNIAAGVTNVRDVGSVYDELVTTKSAFDSNKIIGPNIYPVGLIDKKTDASAPTGILAATLTEALEAVDWYFEKGYQQIKLYSSIEPDWIKPISDHAKSKKMRLSGHVPALSNAEYAVKNGFNEIHHINMLFRNFVLEKNEDYRSSGFALVGERGGQLDLDSQKVSGFIQLLKEKNVTVDLTLSLFHTLYLNKAGEIDPNFAPIADNLPVNIVRDYLLSPTLDINHDNEALYVETTAALRKMTKRLYDAGVPIVAGTDYMAGFGLHSEMVLLAKAGIPNTEVLKIVTLQAAALNGQKKRGFVKVGSLADLILIDGDPTQNIADIRKVSLVIKEKQMYSPTQLYKQVGVIPFLE